MATTFRTWLTEQVTPGWLRGIWGTKLLGVFGDAADRTADAAKDAVKAGFPDLAPSDALPYCGAARRIERYLVDSDATYRARVVDAWNVWEFAGCKGTTSQTPSALGILGQLGAQGLTNATLTPWYQYVSPPAPWTTHWSAFWITIPQPHPWIADGIWSDPGVWGDGVTHDIVPGHNGAPSGPGTWDSDATLYEVLALRNAIRRWKSAHEVCAGIELILSGSTIAFTWAG